MSGVKKYLTVSESMKLNNSDDDDFSQESANSNRSDMDDLLSDLERSLKNHEKGVHNHSAKKLDVTTGTAVVSSGVTVEHLKREAYYNEASREIVEARCSMKNFKYSESARHYSIALYLIKKYPDMKNLRRECEQGVAEALYREAMREESVGRHASAVELMRKALDMRHPKARKQLEAWNERSNGRKRR